MELTNLTPNERQVADRILGYKQVLKQAVVSPFNSPLKRLTEIAVISNWLSKDAKLLHSLLNKEKTTDHPVATVRVHKLR